MSTKTTRFGVSRRENHDSTDFYARGIQSVVESDDILINTPNAVDLLYLGSSTDMHQLESNSVALMVTSPPYHAGKDYDSNVSFEEYLDMLEQVFAETYRVLEPGGRAVVNVANLGRRPYVPLSHLVTERMLKIGFFMRGEVIWRKGKGSNGNCAWGSWMSANNPVIRDLHEYCLCFSKGNFSRVKRGTSTVSAEDFLLSTLSVWEFPPESAKRVGHPAPFPVELPRRFIQLFTYTGDLVLDPFMGSGTTAVAAVQTGRHWIGYETDCQYRDAALARITGAQRLLSIE